MQRDLVLGSLRAAPNEKVQGYVTLAGCTRLPVTLINGREPGQRILITAGVHGAEYPGILAASELAAEIDPADLAGSLAIVHLVNGEGFLARMPALVPSDRKNINRVFPGRADGTPAEQLAAFITAALGQGYGFYLDLHSGDLHEDLLPHGYYSALSSPVVMAASQAAAGMLDISCMVKSHSAVGSLGAAAAQGVPALLLERGGNGIWEDAEARFYKADIYRLLYHWGMLFGCEAQRPLPKVPDFHTTWPVKARRSGLWKPAVRPGDFVAPGEAVGQITDAFGQPKAAVLAERPGLVLCLLSSLAVRRGDMLFFCGVPEEK